MYGCLPLIVEDQAPKASLKQRFLNKWPEAMTYRPAPVKIEPQTQKNSENRVASLPLNQTPNTHSAASASKRQLTRSYGAQYELQACDEPHRIF
jgi:hypothetical protein